ncbi:FecR domain-containing protein [Butyricimonas hominis]|uniref:FecR family protein n=1 Tax=Butyricimonas TaxID=574697 RepID=UPI003516BC59
MMDKHDLDKIEFALYVLQHPECMDNDKVREWLSVAGHEALLEELRAFREAGIRELGIGEPDVEKQWRKMNLREPGKKRMLYLGWWYGIVAMLVVAVGVGLLLKYDGAKEEIPVESGAVMLSGEGGVKLITGKGDEILLGLNVKNVVDVPGEENIVIDSTGILTYVKGDTAKAEKEEYHRLLVPRGGEYAVILDDGSRVWLNSESELRYPVAFGATEREVYLEGEAYFEVKQDEKRPFVVVAREVSTRVLGTEFNVQAYKEKAINVTLVKGCVAVRGGGKDAGEVTLKPGENAAWTGDSFMVEQVDMLKYTAWKDGFFYYDNVRLEDILNELGRWFDFTVSYRDTKVKDYRFNFWANRRETTEEVVERLNETGKLGISLKGKNVIIM